MDKTSSIPRFQLALLLGMTIALGPFAMDAYLPAFPAIAQNFNALVPEVGLTLSVYVMALGFSNLFAGPLSDRYGRAPIMIGGLLAFVASSMLVSWSSTLEEMTFWRIIQGCSGAFCGVSVPAIVRDQTQGKEAANLFGLIGMVMFAAPAVAPSVGSIVVEFSSWEHIFWGLAGYAGLLILLHKLFLFSRIKTKAKSREPLHTLLTNYWIVLSNSYAMRLIVLQTLCFSSVLTYFTNASYIYLEHYAVSKSVFSAVFFMNVAAMAGFTVLNRLVLSRFRIDQVLKFGAFVQLIFVSCALLVFLSGTSFLIFAILSILAVGIMGLIIPNSMASTMEFFPLLGGTAAALLGSVQFVVAGSISALSALVLVEGIQWVLAMMIACASCAALIGFSLAKLEPSH